VSSAVSGNVSVNPSGRSEPELLLDFSADTEALEQSKSESDHWAHLLVHGTLHLLGFDHVDDAGAERMETLETRLLSQSGISDPYEGTV